MEQHSLPGFQTSNTIRVRLYFDEIKPIRNWLNEQWMYIGVLAIPDPGYGRVLELLQQVRADTGYDSEVHFTKLRNYSYARHYNKKTAVAKRWVELVMGDDQKLFHFHLLGLNMDNLQERAFGDKGREQRSNIYNRFFRSALIAAIKWFFGKTNIVVSHIFHDNSSELEQDDFFDWHAIWRFDSAEPGIVFEARQVQFIDSDHQVEVDFPDESHCIQLCDVLTGAFTHALDDRNKKDGCTEVAQRLLPLAERLVDEKHARNWRSRYHHYRRLSLSFFPAKRLSLDELDDVFARQRSGFYKKRRLLLAERLSGQQSLFR